MKHCKVTVVTVCYNAKELLENTIRSVSDQNYEDFEYIVVDGGSTDGTVDILNEYENVIDRWVSEKDRGIYDAMNKAVLMAGGEWVIFMNAGDTFYSPDTLEKVFGKRAVPDTVDIIYGDVAKPAQCGMTVKKAEPVHNGHRMFFCHQSCFARRKALLDHPFDLTHPMSADFKFVKTMVKNKAGFMKLEFPVAYFDTGGVSNRRRSAGLADNIRVVMELDSPFDQIRLLPRLWFSYALCRLRGK